MSKLRHWKSLQRKKEQKMLTNRTEPKKTGNILTNNTIYSNCVFGGGYYCERYWDKNLAKQLGKKRFYKLVQDWRKEQERMEIGLVEDKRRRNESI